MTQPTSLSTPSISAWRAVPIARRFAASKNLIVVADVADDDLSILEIGKYPPIRNTVDLDLNFDDAVTALAIINQGTINQAIVVGTGNGTVKAIYGTRWDWDWAVRKGKKHKGEVRVISSDTVDCFYTAAKDGLVVRWLFKDKTLTCLTCGDVSHRGLIRGIVPTVPLGSIIIFAANELMVLNGQMTRVQKKIAHDRSIIDCIKVGQKKVVTVSLDGYVILWKIWEDGILRAGLKKELPSEPMCATHWNSHIAIGCCSHLFIWEVHGNRCWHHSMERVTSICDMGNELAVGHASGKIEKFALNPSGHLSQCIQYTLKWKSPVDRLIRLGESNLVGAATRKEIVVWDLEEGWQKTFNQLRDEQVMPAASKKSSSTTSKRPASSSWDSMGGKRRVVSSSREGSLSSSPEPGPFTRSFARSAAEVIAAVSAGAVGGMVAGPVGAAMAAAVAHGAVRGSRVSRVSSVASSVMAHSAVRGSRVSSVASSKVASPPERVMTRKKSSSSLRTGIP